MFDWAKPVVAAAKTTSPANRADQAGKIFRLVFRPDGAILPAHFLEFSVVFRPPRVEAHRILGYQGRDPSIAQKRARYYVLFLLFFYDIKNFVSA